MIIKIGLSALFCFCLYDFIFVNATKLILTDPINLVLGVFHELLIGAMLGLLCNLIFDAITTFTQVLGIQSGMGSSNVFNPGTEGSTNALGLFYLTVSLIFFLHFDGLYHLVFIMRKSFEIMPLASFDLNFGALAQNYVFIFNQIFLIALKLILPILAVMFVVDIFVALFAKIMPQANMFFLLMPAKIFLAAFVIIAIMSGFYENIKEFFEIELYALIDGLFR